MIRFQRANIEKNADNKYKELENILDEIGDIKKFSQTFNTVDEMFEDLDK